MHISKINDILDSIKVMDVETYDHLERTALFTFALAKELKFDPKQLEQAYFAGLLHDMGVLSSVSRHTKECAEFGSMMLKFIDGTDFIREAVKHQHNFYLQEEGEFSTLLAEVVALSSEYDELKNVGDLQHEKALEALREKGFKVGMLHSFDEVLKKEELI